MSLRDTSAESHREPQAVYHHVEGVAPSPILMESGLRVRVGVLPGGISPWHHRIPAGVEDERVPEERPNLFDDAWVIDERFESRLHLHACSQHQADTDLTLAAVASGGSEPRRHCPAAGGHGTATH